MKILGLAGSARAGKTSGSNFIVGTVMKNIQMLDDFKLDEHGKLLGLGDVIQEDGTIVQEYVPFNCKNENRSAEFDLWANMHLWPHVKVYSLADPLKQWLMDVFGLTREQCYGKEKYDPTHLTWESISFIPNLPDKKGFMTSREVMEVMGSKFIREVQQDAFISSCMRKIEEEQPKIAIIDDIRADFEAKPVQDFGGQIIRLTRGLSKNISEQTIDDIQPDATLNNADLTIDEAHTELLNILRGWEYEV